MFCLRLPVFGFHYNGVMSAAGVLLLLLFEAVVPDVLRQLLLLFEAMVAIVLRLLLLLFEGVVAVV